MSLPTTDAEVLRARWTEGVLLKRDVFSTVEIRKNPAVRDAAIVAFPDRRSGVGLYAFIETDHAGIRDHKRTRRDARPKAAGAHQIVRVLPRDAHGNLRTEILQLVATNQLDLIEP